MKKILYILLILLFAKNGFSQIIDTCFVNETKTYHVKNQQQNSFLYWEATGGEITSGNPSQTDSVTVRWGAPPGSYDLSVYEKTDNNCEGQIAIVEITVIEKDFDIKLTVPNVFTPNNDGKNDRFEIKADHPPNGFVLTIVNRWGNIVFESENINNSWDGKINGRPARPGTYYYVLKYINREKTETKKGFLHLF